MGNKVDKLEHRLVHEPNTFEDFCSRVSNTELNNIQVLVRIVKDARHISVDMDTKVLEYIKKRAEETM